MGKPKFLFWGTFIYFFQLLYTFQVAVFWTIINFQAPQKSNNLNQSRNNKETGHHPPPFPLNHHIKKINQPIIYEKYVDQVRQNKYINLSNVFYGEKKNQFPIPLILSVSDILDVLKKVWLLFIVTLIIHENIYKDTYIYFIYCCLFHLYIFYIYIQL